LSLFSFITESDSKIISETYKPSTRETKVFVIKPPRDFILGNTVGIKLLVYSFCIFQELTP
jgi:hypothetical protein